MMDRYIRELNVFGDDELRTRFRIAHTIVEVCGAENNDCMGPRIQLD